jgi:hypothetical protein
MDMMRAVKVFGVVSVLLMASGCAQVLTGVVNQVAVAAVDQKVSDVLDRDCNSYRLVRGGDYCEERAFVNPGPEIYCHRTLGAVDCYHQPDPYDVDKTGRTVAPAELATPRYETIKRRAESNRERLRRGDQDEEPESSEPEWRVPEKRPPQNVSSEADI